MQRILIIDDEQEFVTIILKRLRRRGIDCMAAFNGNEAISMIRAHQFDAVLLDMRLPDMDGISVLREILNIRPGTRVLILTGHASIETGREGIALGAFDYLLKPVEFDILLKKLLPDEKTGTKTASDCVVAGTVSVQ